jgi:hypothetical protein
MVSRMSSRRMKAPISRFSSTVIVTKTLAVWGTKPMPAVTRSWGVRPVMSWPSSTMRPSRSGSMPKIAFIAVDLPAPFGPTITAISPFSTAIVQA